MLLRKLSFDQAAFGLACASMIAMLVSIAVANIFLAAAFVALLLSRDRLRFPSFWIPLSVFFAGTLTSLFLSVDPNGGRPAIRKFFIFLIVLALYSTVRRMAEVRALILIASGVMACSAVWSLVQFAHKVREAHALGRPFYTYYTSERITGFTSHWMTLGGEEMIIALMAASLLFFSPLERRWKIVLIGALALILVSLLLGYTRSIWLGTCLGGLYLLWLWKRWWVLAVPVLLALLITANPFALRERVQSAVQPHGDTDSNEFRYVCRRAGVEMIKAHPWFGLGPEQVKAQLKQWIPADVPRPLPTGWYGHLHNIYLQFAAERGIPTAIALFWMIGKILYDFVRGIRRAGANPAARAILHGAIAVVIGMLAVGFYEVNLGDSEVLFTFLAVVTCGYIAVDAVTGARGSIQEAAA
jgi:putative inorganic carbon (hco3(-)) transporter